MSTGGRALRPPTERRRHPPIRASSEPPGQAPSPPPDLRQEREKRRPSPRFAGPAPTASTRCPDAFGQYPAGSRSEDDPCLGLRRQPTGGDCGSFIIRHRCDIVNTLVGDTPGFFCHSVIAEGAGRGGLRPGHVRFACTPCRLVVVWCYDIAMTGLGRAFCHDMISRKAHRLPYLAPGTPSNGVPPFNKGAAVLVYSGVVLRPRGEERKAPGRIS